MEFETIGERLKYKRRKFGLTQKQLGMMLGVSDDAVRLWENDTNDIDSGRCVQIAEILKTSCDWLLTGKDTQNIDIIEVTGLSNSAINILRGCKRDSNKEMNIVPDALSYLIESANPDLFLLIVAYLGGMKTEPLYKKTKSGEYIPLETDKEVGESMLLLQVMQKLIRIKEGIENEQKR